MSQSNGQTCQFDIHLDLVISYFKHWIGLIYFKLLPFHWTYFSAFIQIYLLWGFELGLSFNTLPVIDRQHLYYVPSRQQCSVFLNCKRWESTRSTNTCIIANTHFSHLYFVALFQLPAKEAVVLFFWCPEDSRLRKLFGANPIFQNVTPLEMERRINWTWLLQ